MSRIQLFEFEDLRWFPHTLRQSITLALEALHRIVQSNKVLFPKFFEILERTGANSIVDLCSGGGGPMQMLYPDLAKEKPDLAVNLSDLFPNQLAAARINGKYPNLVYERRSVDATNVPDDLDGLRTMIASFHHFSDPMARNILQDAWQKNRSIAIFELSSNTAVGILTTLMMPLGVLLATPFVRPLSFSQILFTYFLPILPLLITWDGFVSHVRTRSRDELEELVKDLNKSDYTWEIGTLRHRPLPYDLPYLIGHPTHL